MMSSNVLSLSLMSLHNEINANKYIRLVKYTRLRAKFGYMKDPTDEAFEKEKHITEIEQVNCLAHSLKASTSDLDSQSN